MCIVSVYWRIEVTQPGAKPYQVGGDYEDLENAQWVADRVIKPSAYPKGTKIEVVRFEVRRKKKCRHCGSYSHPPGCCAQDGNGG